MPATPRLAFTFPLWFVALTALAKAAPIELPVTQPTSGTIHRWVSLPATMAAFQQVQLHARVAGYVQSVLVDKGDSVKEGQLLAVVQVPELEADLLKHKAELEAAQIEVKRLHEARAKSPDLVLAQTIDNAEARLAAAKAGVERSASLLDFAQIKAPFSGTISSRSVDPGALVSPSGAPLLRLTDSSKLRCQIPVTEMETPLASPGKPVRVAVDALPALRLETRLSRITGVLDPVTRTMLAEADIENSSAQLLPGMSVTAKIAVETHASATLLPVAALAMEKTNAFVFKLVAGKAVKSPVKIAFHDGTSVEVPELRPSDSILLVGSTPPQDGQEVIGKPLPAAP
ncbi:MAG: hypothetical protein RLZZ399_437 [Verrucomicrobiota bacterium]|jgi:membrane fusion protein (multidrug efflux system)